MEIIVTKENFESEVINSDKPVLLDFWAAWCGPCKMLAPLISEIAEEKSDLIKVGKINVDEEIELAGAFRVSAIPTVVVVKGGKAVSSSVGYCDKAKLLSMIE